MLTALAESITVLHLPELKVEPSLHDKQLLMAVPEQVLQLI
jgi:hypothetical protein